MSALINANLFRIAHAFASKEGTRYYLQGVFVVRHQHHGVNLVVTDNHRMIVIHDEKGETDLEGVIVKLDKNALALCKADKREPGERRLRIHGDGEVEILAYEGEQKVSSFRQCIVDGTFPAWDRVIPREFNGEQAMFNGAYLGDFGTAARELTGTKEAALRIVYNGDGPALVRFRTIEHAFGVLMPIRDDGACALPEFYTMPAWNADDELKLAAE